MPNRALKGFLAGALLALALAALAWPALSAGNLALRSRPGKVAAPSGFDTISPFVMPAAAFTADGYDPGSQFFSFGGGYWSGSPDAYGCMIAPAHLPDKARVTDMFATIYDNDGSRNMSVSLRRLANLTGAASTMASASSSSASSNLYVISDSGISDPLIAHPEYSYYVTLCLSSSSLRLYSVRIYFDPLPFRTFVPASLKD